MRFELISLRQASQALAEPFQPVRLTEINEYGCYLFRCEGEMPLHRHLEHDELLWPQDRAILLRGEAGEQRIAAGELARVPRGWKHGSAARHPAHVLLVSRGERLLSFNGYHRDPAASPAELFSPRRALEAAAPNTPRPLTRCDTLALFVERVAGTGPSRRHAGDVLVAPLRGSVGVRCGGLVVVVQEMELARLPARCGWHLFGQSEVLWMTPGAGV